MYRLNFISFTVIAGFFCNGFHFFACFTSRDKNLMEHCYQSEKHKKRTQINLAKKRKISTTYYVIVIYHNVLARDKLDVLLD